MRRNDRDNRERPKIPENEVRINKKTPLGSYVTYILKLFEGPHNEIILKSMGEACSKIIIVAEILKSRI